MEDSLFVWWHSVARVNYIFVPSSISGEHFLGRHFSLTCDGGHAEAFLDDDTADDMARRQWRFMNTIDCNRKLYASSAVVSGFCDSVF